MKKATTSPFIINSVSNLHRMLSLAMPEHPLISLIKYEDIKATGDTISGGLVHNFYLVAIKKGFKGKLKYGRQHYDFDDGIMSFIAPGQVVTAPPPEDNPSAGWMLVVHPDFLRSHPLGKIIKEYGYFSYNVNEALHLSEKEEAMMEAIVENIQKEYRSVTDLFSQKLIISHIELLLNYADRFYHRQFITRSQASNDMLVKIDELLAAHFDNDKLQGGLPTVHDIAQQLHISPGYLSDMMRSLTGQNVQQHIHSHLIEKAKENLATTTLSVSEIAYKLGFEYPQYFSRLFKSKTQVTPLQYRQSFIGNKKTMALSGV